MLELCLGPITRVQLFHVMLSQKLLPPLKVQQAEKD